LDRTLARYEQNLEVERERWGEKKGKRPDRIGALIRMRSLSGEKDASGFVSSTADEERKRRVQTEKWVRRNVYRIRAVIFCFCRGFFGLFFVFLIFLLG
jgi:hypothetical protein